MAEYQFLSHGHAEFRREDRVLIVDLYGPWNFECIREAGIKAQALMEEMHLAGAWGTVVIVHDEMLGTPAAIQEMGENITRNNARFEPVASAWIVGTEIIGRDLMMPIIEDLFKGVVPIQFFTTIPEARRWLEKMIRASA